jgi:hypothetical protein
MTDARQHTIAMLGALAGTDAVYDFRAMHDRDRAAQAVPLRGTFAQCEAQLTALNQAGYGIHVMINETDGVGRLVGNVTRCRAQLLDLDGVDAGQQLDAVLRCSTPPHWIVHTSPGKVQIWWKVIPHADKQLYTDNQRRLIGAYNGDAQFIDAAHTARLAGFYHCKGNPSLVTVAAGPVWGGRAYDAWEIAGPLLHIPLVGGSGDAREPLGYGPWSAPSLDWIRYALSRIDPNALARNEWIAITAATKQAGWLHGPDAVRAVWDEWCSRYGRNDQRENSKQWGSIDATASGWQAIVKRAGIAGDIMAAGLSPSANQQTIQSGSMVIASQAVVGARTDGGQPQDLAGQASAPVAALDTFLSPDDQASYFQGCVWVTDAGRILGPNGRLMDANRFNGKYGGKRFILDATGATSTDEAWKAALRGQVFQVPKADHLRFLPAQAFAAVVHDEFGEVGVNRYRAPKPMAIAGDVTPFLAHVEKLLPVQGDRDVLLSHMAQCVQRPGVKIKWAVVLQSTEGAGKTLFQEIMQCAVGPSYVHIPAAKELTEGGGKFNGWLANKLMIIINEVKSDEKRDLIEVMKPWITDYRIEMQHKGQDQFIYDNPTNWLMFTNYKDAIPISDNSRRYAILYSALQSKSDLLAAGMTGDYFTSLYNWCYSGGAAAVVDWLLRYPIPDRYDGQKQATTAPLTTSTNEAVALSRGWLETLIAEAVEQKRQGFRNGWVSTVAVSTLIKENGYKLPGPRSVSIALVSLGYRLIGASHKIWPQEFAPYQSKLYNMNEHADLYNYGRDQGYEP